MIINGLGGKHYSEQHAIASAQLINATQPEYLATLALFFRFVERRFTELFGEDYVPCSTLDLFTEMQTFIQHLDLNQTIFRSDHISNNLVLKGVLGKDKAKLLAQIQQAVAYAHSQGPNWHLPVYGG